VNVCLLELSRELVLACRYLSRVITYIDRSEIELLVALGGAGRHECHYQKDFATPTHIAIASLKSCIGPAKAKARASLLLQL